MNPQDHWHRKKQEFLIFCGDLLCDPVLSSFGKLPACDGHTDVQTVGQTESYSTYRAGKQTFLSGGRRQDEARLKPRL